MEGQWYTAPQSFESDPPNAALVINQQVQTIILTSMVVEGNKTIFGIKPDDTDSIVPMSGVLQMFVDGGWCWSCCDNGGCCSCSGCCT